MTGRDLLSPTPDLGSPSGLPNSGSGMRSVPVESDTPSPTCLFTPEVMLLLLSSSSHAVLMALLNWRICTCPCSKCSSLSRLLESQPSTALEEFSSRIVQDLQPSKTVSSSPKPLSQSGTT